MASHPSSLRAIITLGTQAGTHVAVEGRFTSMCAVWPCRVDDPTDVLTQRANGMLDHPPPELLCMLSKLTPSLQLIRRRIRIVAPSSPPNGARERIPGVPSETPGHAMGTATCFPRNRKCWYRSYLENHPTRETKRLVPVNRVTHRR